MSNPTDIVLAVDGGGTSTRAWIVRTDGTVLARGASGGSNVFEIGVDVARRVIAEATAAAWKTADLPGEKPCGFLAVFAGVAGAGGSEDQRALASALAAEFGVTPANARVDHDLRIALAGALGGEPGVVLVAGTGAAAYGRDGEGHTARAGGWGPMLDDGGSGYWLGLQAMRLVCRVTDGRVAPTPLADAVKAQLGVASPRELLLRLQFTHAQSINRAMVAALAPLVVAAADSGDVSAGGILDRGAHELAEQAAAVVRRLASMAGPALRLAAAGGLLEANASYFERVAKSVAARVPALRLERPELSPVAGAALLALVLVDARITTDVRRRLMEAA